MKRNLWILIGILILLVIATFLVLQRPGEISRSDSSGTFLLQYDSASVDRMEITSKHGVVRLEKEAGKWMVVDPLRYRADETAVGLAVGKGRTLELMSLVSTNPEKQHLFQVDSTGTLVRIFDRGKEVGAVRIGKMSASFTETYVREEGSNDVHLTEGVITNTFERSASDWRDRSIFRATPDQIQEVQFAYGDTAFTLALRDTAWFIGSDSVPSGTVRSLLGSLASLQSDEFVDSAITPPGRPTAIIQALGVQMRFFYDKSSTKYFVQTSEGPQWFALQEWRAKSVLKRRKELVPATP